MSFYELDRPAASLADRIGGFFAPVRAYGAGLMQSLAYARMMRVMYEMDDRTLTRIGITRADIPAYVDKCLSRD